jgi:hypothetical protein
VGGAGGAGQEGKSEDEAPLEEGEVVVTADGEEVRGIQKVSMTMKRLINSRSDPEAHYQTRGVLRRRLWWCGAC